MPDTPERVPETPTPPKEVFEKPEQMVVPERIQDIAKPTPSQVTTQVTDDSGQQLTQSPATQQVTVTVPADPAQLDDWAKGSPTSALTWLAVFWKRVIKRAMHFGWKIISGGQK